MAAEVLQEFLVNVKYVVDGASQESFLSGLKRVAARVGLLNAELAAIGTGLVVLAKKFAETGNELYQASQRMGMATDEIQSVSNAFWMLGMSTEQARGAMEGFTGFLRSYGPAGIGFLRAFGVSATDNVGRLKELGVELRKLGGADPNSPTYWMAQRLAARVGITDPLAVHYLATGESERVRHGGGGGNAHLPRSRRRAQQHLAALRHQLPERDSTVARPHPGDAPRASPGRSRTAR